MPIKGGKQQVPNSFDDIPIRANNNNNKNPYPNFDDIPIKGAKNNNNNEGSKAMTPTNYDDIPIKPGK